MRRAGRLHLDRTLAGQQLGQLLGSSEGNGHLLGDAWLELGASDVGQRLVFLVSSSSGQTFERLLLRGLELGENVLALGARSDYPA